jgi:hypothetical protein
MLSLSATYHSLHGGGTKRQEFLEGENGVQGENGDGSMPMLCKYVRFEMRD